VIATLFGLVIEIDSFVMASLATGLVRKVLVTVGGASTVRLAVFEAAPAAGVCVVVTPLAVFGLMPTLLLVTWTVIVHPVTGRFDTFKLRLVAPTVNAGLLLVPTHVPPIVVELTLMFVNATRGCFLYHRYAQAKPAQPTVEILPPEPPPTQEKENPPQA
jgi:hypothetical protein